MPPSESNARGPHAHNATALSVVIFRHVNSATRGEVGVEMKLLSAQIVYGSLAQFVEVMWQNL